MRRTGLVAFALAMLLTVASATVAQPPPSATPPDLPAELWIGREGRPVRLERAALEAALRRGEIGPDTWVWVEGAWRKAAEVAFLAPHLVRREQVTLTFTVPPDTPGNRRRLARELWESLQLAAMVRAMRENVARALGRKLAAELPEGSEAAAGEILEAVGEIVGEVTETAAREELVEMIAQTLDTRTLAFQLAVNRHPDIEAARERLYALVPEALERVRTRLDREMEARLDELCERLRAVLVRHGLDPDTFAGCAT